MHRILLVEDIHPAGKEILAGCGEVVLAESPAEEALLPVIGGFDAMVVRSSRVGRELIEAGTKLKVIARHGIGVDNIDLDAAAERGIVVVNTPEANYLSVAEHTVAAMLALAKRFAESDRAVREGVFCGEGSLPGMVTKLGYATTELYGKTVGLLGAGRIAARVAQICGVGFGMKVCGFDAFKTPEEMRAAGIEPRETPESAVADADFVSVHMPLTDATRGMVDGAMLRRMKPTAVLVNAARGGIVDEEALVCALKNGTIAAAAVDVYASEPPAADHPFFALDNVLLTPHAAGMTDAALMRQAVGAAEGVADVLAGRRPKYPVQKR